MSSDPPSINPDDLEPTIDLELKIQKKILQLCLILETADHYELLGVPRSAEKKEIRNAYFSKMNEFHTDKFYGKNIGAFGPRLQKIIQKLTRASDTLSRKKTRAEYDKYLESRQTTLGARVSVAPLPRSSPPPEVGTSDSRPGVAPAHVVPEIPRAPKAPSITESELSDGRPTGGESSKVASSSHPSSARDPVPSSAARSSGTPRGPASTDAARRMLARKMGARGANSLRGTPRPSASSRPPAADPSQVKRAVQDDLRKRYEARRGSQSAQKLAELAEAAAAQGDWPSAVNSLKLACRAAPDDAVLHNRLEELQLEADRSLAPRFLEQARYEEKDGRHDRAARSYERAARGRNSAELFEKSAQCLLKVRSPSDDEKRKLVEMARKSVTLDNRSADYRMTLAKAYDVAGMRTSAQGEVRRALELEPNNKDAKELQKALK